MMRNRAVLLSFGLLVLLAGCGGDGMSTREMQAAAVERARQQLNIPESTPLDAEVWAGNEWRGDLVLCGTVSGRGPGSPIAPQRFAATTDPLRWLIFENATNPPLQTGEEEFPDWVDICGQVTPT